jgi:RadC-like JAB domain
MREIRGDVFQGRFHNLLISKNNTFWAPQISRITFQVVTLRCPLPSQEDRALTVRLVQAGKLLGVEVLDHIIVGEEKYFSFADEGLLDRG